MGKVERVEEVEKVEVFARVRENMPQIRAGAGRGATVIYVLFCGGVLGGLKPFFRNSAMTLKTSRKYDIIPL